MTFLRFETLYAAANPPATTIGEVSPDLRAWAKPRVALHPLSAVVGLIGFSASIAAKRMDFWYAANLLAFLIELAASHARLRTVLAAGHDLSALREAARASHAEITAVTALVLEEQRRLGTTLARALRYAGWAVLAIAAVTLLDDNSLSEMNAASKVFPLAAIAALAGAAIDGRAWLARARCSDTDMRRRIWCGRAGAWIMRCMLRGRCNNGRVADSISADPHVIAVEVLALFASLDERLRDEWFEVPTAVEHLLDRVVRLENVLDETDELLRRVGDDSRAAIRQGAPPNSPHRLVAALEADRDEAAGQSRRAGLLLQLLCDWLMEIQLNPAGCGKSNPERICAVL